MGAEQGRIRRLSWGGPIWPLGENTAREHLFEPRFAELPGDSCEHKMKQDRPDQCAALGKRAGRRPVNTGLVVSPVTFGEDANIQGLIDDWIVPALVEQFLRSKKVLPDSSREEHN